MRNTVASLLHNQMKKDDRIIILTADLGFGLWDKIQKDFPDRFHNIGSAEQLMMGVAVGLALSKKIPVCYSISPFILYRPAEWIRNYLIHEQIGVKLIGSGRNRDYTHDGFTHWEDYCVIFPSITVKPNSIAELQSCFHNFLYNEKPQYMNLPRVTI